MSLKIKSKTVKFKLVIVNAFNAITIIMNQNNLDQYQLKPQIFFIGFNASKRSC